MSEQTPQEQEEHNMDQLVTEFSRGQVLANARQSMGISLEDLSEQIRVPLKVLQQIEADDLPTNLPETFVRGYIRSYAKKVGVDEHLVLNEVETLAASSADAMEMHSFSKRSKRKRVERRLTIISWVIVGTLAIALVAWWVQTKGTEMFGVMNSSTSEVIEQQPAVEQSGEDAAEDTANAETNLEQANPSQLTTLTDEQSGDDQVAPEQSIPQSQLRVKPELQADVEAADAQPKSNEVEAAQVTSLENNSNTENTNSDNTSNEDLNTASTNNATTNTATTNTETAEQAPIVLNDEQKRLLADNGEVDEADFIKVEFEFENDCWVEVYDAFDERIAIGNKNAGYVMTLNAQGPFRVLLGNPDGVRIWVNGDPFDMSHLPKNRVARFEVDANL